MKYSLVRNKYRRVLNLATVFLFLCSQTLLGVQNSVQLTEGWVIKTGDNAEWAGPEVDDRSWQAIEVGVPWERVGLADYDGFAWYRLTFTVPQDWHPLAKHGFLSLSLGYIDDVDVTYFNGSKVGATGSMPPDYSMAYDRHREYRVPTEWVRWGQANVIAVRVYDGEGNGGLCRGSFALKLPEFDDLVKVHFRIENGNGIYFSSGGLPVTLAVKNHSLDDVELDAVIILLNDRVDKVRELAQINTALHIAGMGEVSRTMQFPPPAPGFYRVVCTLSGDIKRSITLGYEPEKIKTPLTREPDFKQFWKQRKQDLARVAPQYQVTRSNRSTEDIDVYLVEMRSYGNVRIRAWYTVPKKALRPLPAILSVPGYTSTMWPNMNRNHVATLALNPRGHGNSKDDVDPRGQEYMFIGFDPKHPENYIYAGAYMDCLRAVDFLVSRPEIDKGRIGVEGGSQGGGLSFATAALDSRIVCCAPDIPWLCDWVGYMETDDWARDNYPRLFKAYPDLSFTDINRFLSTFDTMNMAEWISCPVLMSVGLQDKVCPPRPSFATYNAVKAPKEYRVYPFAGHSVWRQHHKTKNGWMAEMLGVAPGL